MKRKTTALVAALAAALLIVGGALAAVTFDPETGTGFVGKGDVQLAFGWNNKALQDNATHVTFSWQETGEYTVVCTGHSNPAQNPKTFTNKEIGVESSLDGDPRQVKGQKQFTGFILTGLVGDPTVTGEGCPSAWPTELSRTPNDDAGTALGLYAHFGGQSVLIWTPPAAE